jgi:glycosyltransferase involved in cell wall biosynthesis
VNVLQVTPTNVYPPSHGGQHRSHGIVTSFPDAGDGVYRYCQGGHLENYWGGPLKKTIRLGEGYVEFQHLNPAFDLARSPELFGLPNVFLGRSLRVVKPTRLLDRLDWADLTLVEHPWQVPAVADLADTTPVVYSSHNVEHERFESAHSGVVGDWFTEKVRSIERTALERSTAVVCTSQRDVDEYNRRYNVDTTTIVAPNGVTRDALRSDGGEQDAGERVRDDHGIGSAFLGLFVGTDYGPNREAVETVLRMATHAAEADLDMHFLVVGSVGDSVASSPDNVTVTGLVPDLDPYFAAADVGLNPIRSGSGTNIKLVEYLAKGLPVVTTPFGARGFDIDHEREALVVEDEAFLDAMTRLATDPDLRSRLVAAGQAYVRRQHTWERISADLRDRLVDLLADVE